MSKPGYQMTKGRQPSASQSCAAAFDHRHFTSWRSS